MPATPAVQLNPTTFSWVAPTKFVTDGTVFTAAGYEFGYKALGSPADYTVVTSAASTAGKTAVAVKSLGLPLNENLTLSTRVVATNGQLSAWATPGVNIKLTDTRVPESPSALVLS